MTDQAPQLDNAGRQTATIVAMSFAVAFIVGGLLAFFWADVVAGIRTWLGPPLHRLHSPLDHFLSSLPMWSAQVCAIGLFAIGLIFAWSLPRRFVYLGAPDQARWRDLRLWATAVLVPYMLIYLLLGL